MGFFSSFSKKQSPKQVAKDRLRLILIHDRGDIPEETIEKISQLERVVAEREETPRLEVIEKMKKKKNLQFIVYKRGAF